MGLDNPLHIAFLLVILLLVFGAKRLPEMGRSLGSGLRGFKETLSTESTPASELMAVASTTAPAPTEAANTAVPAAPAPAPSGHGAQRAAA
jgi:sec-independent protein translocase protein TatA